MFDTLTYSGDTGGLITLVKYEACRNAWNNRGGAATKNTLELLAGVAIKSLSGQVLARVTEDGLESFCDKIFQMPISCGAAKETFLLSVPADSYLFCLEDARQEELQLTLTGADLSVAVKTAAREIMVQVQDETRVAAVEIAQQNSQYSIEILNTRAQPHEEVFLEGVTGAERLHLVQNDGRLYAKGLNAHAALFINDEAKSLDHIGRLLEEHVQEDKEALMISAKTEENEDEAQP